MKFVDSYLTGKGYVMNIMAMIGKFFISFTYVGIYVIIVESYPTIIRNSALSINSFIARFGSVTAPNILLLVILELLLYQIVHQNI